MMSKRCSRIIRSSTDLPAIRITQRDKAVFQTITDYKLITTSQIARLHFTSLTRVQKRLKLLWQHRYVNRKIPADVISLHNSELFYEITLKGKKLINYQKYNARYHSRSIYGFEHRRLINEFRSRLEADLKSYYEVKLVFWKEGRKIALPIVSSRSTKIVADAFFCLEIRNQKQYYYLEIDRETTPLKRLEEKIKGYCTNYNQMKYNNRKVNIPFQVLYFTYTNKRAKALHKIENTCNLNKSQVFSYNLLSSSLLRSYKVNSLYTWLHKVFSS